MSLNIKIESERIILRPFTVQHLSKKYLDWLNDKSLMQFSEQKFKLHCKQTSHEYLLSFVGTPHFFWAIEEKATGNHLGNINAFIDPVNQTANLGILVGKGESSLRGIGTEAWMTACDFLFRHAQICRITAGTLCVNLRMVRIFEKSGMQKEESKSQRVIWMGKVIEKVHFTLLGSEWLKNHKKSLVKLAPLNA